MRYLYLLPLLFSLFLLSCGSDQASSADKTSMQSTEFMDGKGNLDLPKGFEKDDYHLSKSNPHNVRFKSPDNSKSVTLQHLPKMFSDLQVGISMMEQESLSKGSKVIRREIQEINGRPFAIQESELKIDQNPTYKIDALTILDNTLLSVNISCYQKDKDQWSAVASKILESIAIQ